MKRNHRKEFYKYKLNIKDKGIIKANSIRILLWKILTNKYDVNTSSRKTKRLSPNHKVH